MVTEKVDGEALSGVRWLQVHLCFSDRKHRGRVGEREGIILNSISFHFSYTFYFNYKIKIFLMFYYLRKWRSKSFFFSLYDLFKNKNK